MVIYCADLLQEYAGEDGQDLVAKILDLGYGMTDMTTQLLNSTSLQTIQEDLKPLSDIREIIQKVLLRFEREIQQQRVHIEIADSFPIALGSRVWVTEILANLIGNAIKYIGKNNPAPQVRIEGIEKEGLVFYQVIDNGLGIPKANQANIWDKFTRFHKGEAIGFGLGLSIVAELTLLQKGQVGFESEANQGSTFWFALPKA
jgi:signal transduction histidine kinase